MYKDINDECQWNPEKHHGEPCPHHEGGNFENFKKPKKLKKYYYIDNNGNKQNATRFQYEKYKKLGKNVIEEDYKDIILTNAQEKEIKDYINNINFNKDINKEYVKMAFSSVLGDLYNKIGQIMHLSMFRDRDYYIIGDSFYDELKTKYDKYFDEAVKEGKELLNKFNKIQGEHTLEEDLKAVNSENYYKTIGTSDFEKFSNNCQSCVQAYVLRRMGYDVEAKAKEDDKKLTNAGWTYAMFIQSNFEFKSYKATYENDYNGEKLQVLGNRVRTQFKNIKSIVENDKDGSIYICKVKWTRGNCSHVFIVENQNGQAKFVDPQNGKSAERYFEKDYTGWYQISPQLTSLTKIDNFDVSKYADLVVKNK